MPKASLGRSRSSYRVKTVGLVHEFSFFLPHFTQSKRLKEGSALSYSQEPTWSSSPGIPDDGTLGEPPTPTIVHVRSILNRNCSSYLLYVLDKSSFCLSNFFSVACFSPLSYYLEKVSHKFRYKILLLPHGQSDTQPVIAMTQLQERSSTNWSISPW